MPAALSHILASDTYNWFYDSEPEPHLNNRKIYCPRGRVLGGSSSINGMIYVRGHPEDFNQWAQRPGLQDWDYEHCLPYFKKAENYVGGESTWRGVDGPMQVNQGKLNNPLFHAWLKAGAEMGHAVRDDFNSEHQEGFGVFDQTINKGKRFSTARGYLHSVKQRTNLTIIPKATVHKIRFGRDSQGNQTRAEAIEVMINGKQQTIQAGTKIILCSGAINTPQLMMLSGVGDSVELERHGIDVKQHLPGVGKNLQDHLETYVQFSCKKPVSIFPALKWYNQPAIGMQWYLRQTGAGATNHFETGAFLRSRPELKQPDLQYHFLPIAMNYDGSDKHNGHGFQFHVGPMKPTSRGEVTLNSANPADAPKINFNYNATQEDQDTIRRGVEIAREIAQQDAFAEYVDAELNPGSIDIDTFVRSNSHSAYHPSCSCRMGTDDMAVVDGRANVHGIEKLSIVDASIMPDITNGNLNAPVIMMAEKLADVLLGNEALAAGTSTP